MNLLEQNAVLYYADYLSLMETNTTVTDNCKYYFIYKSPINVSYLSNNEPFYDLNNKYYLKSYNEYMKIRDKFGEDGVESFVNVICNLQAKGTVNAEEMLKCIHQYSTKQERIDAFKQYKKWKNNIKYAHIVHDEQGEEILEPCTKYVAHTE